MSPSFYPRLINGGHGDPGLFVPFAFERRAFVFDLGDLHPLSGRDIQKITHGFITHTHMDHFIGFDMLVRLLLGRDKILHLFGPAGFLSHVEGKLAGYAWNLVENYSNRFEIRATEISADRLLTQTYRCRDRFEPDAPPEEAAFAHVLLKEPALTISTEILDHQIPCLGFCLHERFHVNVITTEVEALGLSVGPWLKRFKSALYEDRSEDSLFEIEGDESRPAASFPLKELSEKIARITPGQKITYIADTAFTRENSEKIISLAKNADCLFIESAFFDKDNDIAREKHHLTARQAGMLAGRADVREFILFHFSPRYPDCAVQMRQEAEKAYQEARSKKAASV